MPQQLLERQRTSTKTISSPSPIRKGSVINSGAKSASLAFTFLGLIGVSFGIAMAPTLQPGARVKVAPSTPPNSYRMDLMGAYSDQGLNVSGSRSSQYQSQTMKTGDINSLRSRAPNVIASAPPSPVREGEPVTPIAPAPSQSTPPATPIKPQPLPPVAPSTPQVNPLDNFMGSMSNALSQGLMAIGSVGNSGAVLVGNVAGAGIKVGNAAMNVSGQVVNNVGSNTSNALNNAAQNISNLQPMQNNAPTPNLDSGNDGPPNNNGGDDGNNNNPGDNNPSNGDSPGGLPNQASGEPNYGGDSTLQSSPGPNNGGPCGEPPPCSRPPSPCEQNTSFNTGFIKR